MSRKEGSQRTRLRGAAVLDPGSPGGCGGSGQQLRSCLKSQAGSVPSKAQSSPARRAADPRNGLSSPLKMGCDLLQSLSFGFRDAEDSEQDAEDAKGGGEPESAIGPECLLQTRGKGQRARAEVRGPPAIGSQGPGLPCPGSSRRRAGVASHKPGLSTAQ